MKNVRVQKRDGSLQAFNKDKIKKALLCSFNDGPYQVPLNIDTLVSSIVDSLNVDDKSKIINIEDIQDTVEKILMKEYPETAKQYILYRQNRANARKERLKPDNKALADYIHIAKYSRFDPELGRRELYEETVNRVMRMHLRKYPELHSIIHEAFDFVLQKKVLPSMRSMQFAGPAIETHNARMYNCSFTLIDRLEVFGQILYLLLCGCGVGFSIQWCHVEQLPKLNRIGKTVQHYTIPDSIEGWARAINELIFSFIKGYHIEFNYSMIRPEGSPLKTSGGLAPGHLPLKKTIENIRKVLLKAQNRQLRPIECYDIICFIAEAVLAGGIRRSSLIALFSANDTEMLYAKAPGSFDPIKELNSQRMMANNSAVLFRNQANREDFNRIIRIANEGFGDPGFFFSNHPDFGCNPCAEIGLYPVYKYKEEYRTGFSFCNLCEINMASIKDEQEFYKAAEIAATIGTLQASYTDFPFLGSVTEDIVKRDALLGVGLTGMMDNPELAFNKNYLQEATKLIKAQNAFIASKIGICEAKRCTTIKPGGTAPLELGGVASGIHPHHARRYFRRVTANPLEPALLHFMKYNPHMIETKPNGDKCITFPIEVPPQAKTVKEMSAENFIRSIFFIYDNWILEGTREIEDKLTHNVSATITMDESEQEHILELVYAGQHRIAAMSFAPRLLDKKFPFAPREEVTPADESRWNYLISMYKPVDWTTMHESNMEILNADIECSGQKCEI